MNRSSSAGGAPVGHVEVKQTGLNMQPSFGIRAATAADWKTIADFNIRLAAESEHRHLDRATVEAGVRAVLSDLSKGRYFVACLTGHADAPSGQIVGQLMHTREWSDWRNGDLWWLQSVYVHPDFRRSGVFRRLYEHLESEAERDPGVVGVRLYVECDNERAQRAYESLRFKDARYAVMERMFDV